MVTQTKRTEQLIESNVDIFYIYSSIVSAVAPSFSSSTCIPVFSSWRSWSNAHCAMLSLERVHTAYIWLPLPSEMIDSQRNASRRLRLLRIRRCGSREVSCLMVGHWVIELWWRRIPMRTGRKSHAWAGGRLLAVALDSSAFLLHSAANRTHYVVRQEMQAVGAGVMLDNSRCDPDHQHPTRFPLHEQD